MAVNPFARRNSRTILLDQSKKAIKNRVSEEAAFEINRRILWRVDDAVWLRLFRMVTTLRVRDALSLDSKPEEIL